MCSNVSAMNDTHLGIHEVEDLDAFLRLAAPPQHHHERGVRDHVGRQAGVQHLRQELLRLKHVARVCMVEVVVWARFRHRKPLGLVD